ncbi:hypothetical protein [Lentilactobacillus sp. Marseille-Q4993]|uniref:hypothetical protein n=1 Tax=Lentilactobacillus sp. Marseille-Q4993 TaxID=3039492 RepID=UPI0024BC1D86|nr:hypothetical protein [Lentilactobacillus sp. Marseille-Q4993]
MKRDVTDFVETVKADQVEVKEFELSLKQLIKAQKKDFTDVFDFIAKQVSSDKLGVAEIKVSDTDAVVRLETNVINLPIQEIDRVKKMMGDEGELEINIYLVATSEFVNQSGLRIDEVASAADFAANPDDFSSQMLDWISDQATKISEGIENDKKLDKKKTTKK